MTQFDPFQKFVWEPYDAAFEEGGEDAARAAVELKEAPLGIFVPQRELAIAVAEKHGIKQGHLRFAVLPDAKPAVAPREAGEVPGMHFNVIGARQTSIHKATPVERAIISELANGVATHLEETFNPADGVAIAYFGNQVPTVHGHVIPRLKAADGVDHWTDRSVDSPTPLEMRQEMREQAAVGAVKLGVLNQIVTHTLEQYA